MNALTQYLELAREQRAVIDAHAPEAMNALRAEALRHLDGATLPRKGDEDYEATDLEAVFAPNYGVNLRRVDFARAQGSTPFTCGVAHLSTRVVHYHNDIPAVDEAARLLDGVVVETFTQAAVHHPEVLRRHLGSAASLHHVPTALNTLLAQDGILVLVPRGVHASRPVQLISVLNAGAPLLAARRLLVVLEPGSSVQLLVCDHTAGTGHDYLPLQVTEIIAGEDATCDFYDMEESSSRTHRVAATWVKQQRGSNVLVDSITLTNGFTRNDFHVDVDGENATTHLLGMCIAGGRQHVDNRTFLSHNAPACTSREMFKYVLNDEAVGAFAGKILVKPGCPRTDAYQGNRNLVASPAARMHTKPQLEIYTDDVKCAHGSTIGQLDEEALFYMRSRGIGLEVARTLLMQAFMDDVVEAVRLPSLKQRLRHLVERRFVGAPTLCSGCDLTPTP